MMNHSGTVSGNPCAGIGPDPYGNGRVGPEGMTNTAPGGVPWKNGP